MQSVAQVFDIIPPPFSETDSSLNYQWILFNKNDYE